MEDISEPLEEEISSIELKSKFELSGHSSCFVKIGKSSESSSVLEKEENLSEERRRSSREEGEIIPHDRVRYLNRVENFHYSRFNENSVLSVSAAASNQEQTIEQVTETVFEIKRKVDLPIRRTWNCGKCEEGKLVLETANSLKCLKCQANTCRTCLLKSRKTGKNLNCFIKSEVEKSLGNNEILTVLMNNAITLLGIIMFILMYVNIQCSKYTIGAGKVETLLIILEIPVVILVILIVQPFWSVYSCLSLRGSNK